jgi:hypothetical protein
LNPAYKELFTTVKSEVSMEKQLPNVTVAESRENKAEAKFNNYDLKSLDPNETHETETEEDMDKH